ncbi:hypothetical protein EMIT0P265_10797 [Pseudomonas zeae]
MFALCGFAEVYSERLTVIRPCENLWLAIAQEARARSGAQSAYNPFAINNVGICVANNSSSLGDEIRRTQVGPGLFWNSDASEKSCGSKQAGCSRAKMSKKHADKCPYE